MIKWRPVSGSCCSVSYCPLCLYSVCCDVSKTICPSQLMFLLLLLLLPKNRCLFFIYVCFYNPLLLLFVCVLYFLETRLFQILMIQRFKSKLVHQPDDVVVSIVCWRLLAAKKVTANLLPYSIPVVTVGFNLSWTMQLLFPFSQLLNFLTDASTTKSKVFLRMALRYHFVAEI